MRSQRYWAWLVTLAVVLCHLDVAQSPKWAATYSFGGWDMAAVVTVQSGTALTIAETNANNVFGISEDRAELSGTCSKAQLLTGGPTASNLNNYFNRSCFRTPPVVGADRIGTGFGNSGTGIVDDPDRIIWILLFRKLLLSTGPGRKVPLISRRIL
jgi:hypothetical protein